MEALRGCVEKLPARSQRMLHLRYWEELRAAEIGRDLGMNGGAVRIGLLRSREALLACIRSRLGVVLSEALS
jgi:DNA-directed RNA polymerase specialized sigma24 family protein